MIRVLTDWDPLSPGEEKDYSLDWEDKVEGDDAINSSTWVVPEGLSEEGSTYLNKSTTVWLTTSVTEGNFELINTVTTTGGRTYEQTARLRVRQL